MPHALKIAIANILLVVLCLGMVGAGMIKLMSLESVVIAFENWGLPAWFRYMIGAIEFIAGLCIFIPATRKYALMILLLEMLGALTLHLIYGEYWDARGPVMVMLSSGLLLYLERFRKGE